MSLTRRSLVMVLLAGALVRLVVLPVPGTVDVEALKMWSYGTTEDFTGIYGVGGTPLERRMVHWGELSGVVTYPPMSLTELAVIGRIYRTIRPDFPNSTLLTLLIKVPVVASEILFVAVLLTWGRRLMGSAAAEWAAMALWLSPAIWYTGSALGYSDAQAALPLVLALLCALTNRPVLVGVFVAVSALTKPQAVFLIPALAILLLQHGRPSGWRALWRAAVGGSVATTVIITPFVIRGAFLNLMQAMSRLFQHDMLSAQAANLGWIGTWVLRAAYGIHDLGWRRALSAKIRILGITRVMELGYPNPRTVGTALVLSALAWATWRLSRGVSRAAAAALAAWSIYAYMVLGAQVHENHLYFAVPLLALAAGELPALRSTFWIVSGIFVLNIYLFEGFGMGYPMLIDRGWTVVDMTVVLSFVNVGVFMWFTRRVALLTRAPVRGTPGVASP